MSVQTSYGYQLTAIAIEGQLADNGPHDIIAKFNSEASASIPFGRGVAFDATDADGALLPAAETDRLMGIVIHARQYDSVELTSSGLAPGATLNVLRKGRVYVRNNDTTTVAPGDTVWVRAVAGGGEVIAGFEGTDDSTDMIAIAGTWMSLTAAGAIGIIDVDFTAVS